MKVHPHPEPDEPFNYRNSMLWRRFLVFALGLSFVACLLALWATGTVIATFGKLLPLALMIFIQSNRLLILIIPLLSLLACYLLLRQVTGDIMACPDRYLDERQRMVRDRAHHHAYKIVNFACLLIVVCLSLNAILFPVRPSAIAKRSAFTAVAKPISFVLAIPQKAGPVTTDKAGNIWLQEPNNDLVQAEANGNDSSIITIDKTGNQWFRVWKSDQSMPTVVYPTRTKTLVWGTDQQIFSPAQDAIMWPNDPVSISIFYSVLLLSLFLLVKVLPMSVVAWKERS